MTTLAPASSLQPPAPSSSLSAWLGWQETLSPQAIDLSLGRIERVLGRLRWQRPSIPVLTVAGTNGKGSCVALLAAILAAAGYRTGTFTSPHLHRYNERIRLAGVDIDDTSLVVAFERIEAARDGEALTFFEFNTLAALLVFDTAALDCIVLEVGLGGRLDAVNVVDADAALVTSIGLDHCEWLGTTLEAIGSEKAGIFRAGRPAVFGSRDMPRSVQAAASGLGVPLKQLGRDFDFTVADTSWSWQGDGLRIDGLPPPGLPGQVQHANAAAVIALLHSLSPRLSVTRQAITAGLQSVRLAGRFESRPGTVPWIFDVAHNPAAAQVLARNLDSLQCAGRTIAVCGILGDKDAEGIAANLRAQVDVWIVAGLAGPRAVPGDELAARLKRSGIVVAEHTPDVVSACERADAIARTGDRVIVFGSFLTVGPARTWHSLRHATP